MQYLYSATFFLSGDGKTYFARVPDLPCCISTGHSLRSAIAQITDAAALWLVVAEDEGLPIPAATPQQELEHTHGCVFSLIQVDTVAYRALTDANAVCKTVFLPAKLAAFAESHDLNCSQLLQEALRSHLSAT